MRRWRAMARVEQSVRVEVPVPVAYRQWARVEDFPLFFRGVLRVERAGSGLTRWTVRTGGAIREFDARVTERIEDERIAWASVTGDLRQSGVVTFHRVDGRRTTVMLQLDVRLGPAGGPPGGRARLRPPPGAGRPGRFQGVHRGAGRPAAAVGAGPAAVSRARGRRPPAAVPPGTARAGGRSAVP
ncbi:SRPBCC family protein [Kitasatospora arboriphila]